MKIRTSFLLLLLTVMTALVRGQIVNQKGTKEQDTVTVTVSGTVVTMNDVLGTQTNQFEIVPTGSPATVSVVIVGCMRASTCSSTLASTTSTSAVLLSTSGGPYDSYRITVSWTGGSSPTIKINRTATAARSGSSSGGAPALPSTSVQYNCAGAFCGSSSFLWGIPGGTAPGDGLYINSGTDFSGILPPNNPTNVQMLSYFKSPNDKDTYFGFQSGNTTEARDYLAFFDHTGNFRWLAGKNAGAPGAVGTVSFGNFIIFDSTTNGGTHRIVLIANKDGVTGGNTYINAAGTGGVVVNGDPGLSDTNPGGTGGFSVNSASGTQIWGIDNTGVVTENGQLVFHFLSDIGNNGGGFSPGHIYASTALVAPPGTTAINSLSFGTDPKLGMHATGTGGAGHIIGSVNNADVLEFNFIEGLSLLSQSDLSFSATDFASRDANITRLGSGLFAFGSGAVNNTTAKLKASGYMSVGTKFTTNNGCTDSATAGGGTAGTFTVGSTSCTEVVTMGDSATSPNGWSCTVVDITTLADVTNPHQTTSTTTTATFVTGTVVVGDKIQFSCEGY